MKLNFPFSKYEGSGNEFIFIDNRSLFFPRNLVSHLCDRKKGVGADGVITVESSSSADFKMKVYNADGGEAEMCGNGARCLLLFLHEIGEKKEAYRIETLVSYIHLRFDQELICVSMPQPYDYFFNIKININKRVYLGHYINTGVPHVVIFVKNIKNCHLMTLAPKIRYHPRFQPHGVNVNYVKIDSQEKIYIRTYERGVESETLACGTGAAAAALVIAQLYEKMSPISLIPASRETLKIHFKKNAEAFDAVELQGPARFMFRGELSLEIKKN